MPNPWSWLQQQELFKCDLFLTKTKQICSCHAAVSPAWRSRSLCCLHECRLFQAATCRWVLWDPQNPKCICSCMFSFQSNLSFYLSSGGLSKTNLDCPVSAPFFCRCMEWRQGSAVNVSRRALVRGTEHQINRKAAGRDRTPVRRNGLCLPLVKR